MSRIHLSGRIAFTTAVLVCLVSVGDAQVPCTPPSFLTNSQGGIGIKRGHNYTWKIDYQYDIAAYSWWSENNSDRELKMSEAFELWEQADSLNTINATFTQVGWDQPADFNVRVYLGSGLLPGCVPQVPGQLCDETAHLRTNQGDAKVNGGDFYFRPVLPALGVKTLGIHVVGHGHGLADNNSSAAIGNSVMANQIPWYQRVFDVSPCDSTVAAAAAEAVFLGVRPDDILVCGPGGCGQPAWGCLGGWDFGIGWCFPPGGAPMPGTSTWTCWILGNYSGCMAGSAPALPAVQVASPPSGAVLPGPWSGQISLHVGDTDGRVVKADYYVNTQYFATVTEWPYALNVSGAPAGSYWVTVGVTDNGGNVGWSQPSLITIQGGSGGSSSGTLTPWQRLYGGQTLTSSNGAYYVTHQGSDGNFVLYTANGVPIWDSHEFSPNGGGYTEMDGVSGNLVSYRSWSGDPWSPFPYWAANPQVSANSYLRLNDDGSLKIYNSGGTMICQLFPAGGFCP